MSVHVFARATKLHNVCGRVDYVTSPDKQENLMATYSTVEDLQFWKKLAKDSQAAYRQAGGKKEKAKCCEAREIFGDLPDSAKNKDLNEVARKLAKDFKDRTGADCIVGIHYNKKKNNLHFHLVYSERELLQDPEIRIADRNAWIDENGIRKRTKKEILGEDGQLRPGCRIVPKGEIISERYFGDKNPMFADMGWLYNYKHDLAEWINRELDPDEKREVFDKFGPYLAQKHIGKGVPEAKESAIKDWNHSVKLFNDLIKDGILTPEYAIEKKTQIALAPDQLQELNAIISEIYCEELTDLTPAERDAYEELAASAAAEPRTEISQDEERKRKLRDAHRRATLAWQAYRNSEPGSVEQKELLGKARAVSAEIGRLERELGYDRPKRTSERRQAVWDVSRESREKYQQNNAAKEKNRKIRENRSDAWDEYRRKQEKYRALNGYWTTDLNGKRIKVYPLEKPSPAELHEAQLELQIAREELGKAKREAQAINQAYRLQQEFRSYALRLASNPDIPQEEADRALEKYRRAVRLLQEPSARKVKELQHQLRDLQRSQLAREKAREENKIRESGNTSFAGDGVGGDR